MDTKDTAEKTASSVAPAKPAPKPRPGEPEPEEPIPSVPLSRAWELLSVHFPWEDLKAKRRRRERKQWIWESKGKTLEMNTNHPVRYSSMTEPAESAPSASDHPPVSSPSTTTLQATHTATSSPTLTPPMAEGLGFTGIPYPTYGVTPAAFAPPMATAVSEPVASSSTYTGICESMPRGYDDDYHKPATGVYMTGIPGYAAPEAGYTMPTPGFTSLSGLRGLSHVGEGTQDQKDPQISP